jgi:S-adenosyl-L-methionine hydrolase (adenosine-forming)
MPDYISLTSDFGHREEWVGVLKGVILSINPAAKIVDISHEIPPYDISKGAFVLAAALPHMPQGVHMAVVDPGVGSGRRAVAIRAARGDLLVGPDNGLLLPGAERLGGVEEAWSLDNQDFFRTPVHPTFHARDIFAPVAAHISRGTPARDMGSAIPADELVPAPWDRARQGEAALYATVIDVDRFGSLRLNAYPEQMVNIGYRIGDKVMLGIGEEEFEAPLVSTFSDVEAGKALLFEDSSGFMAVAMNGVSLAEWTGAQPGQIIILYARP